MRNELKMDMIHENNRTIWKFSGDLILEETEPVRETFYQWFEGNPKRDLRVDIKNLKRLDAAGISLFISFHNVLKNQNRKLELRNVPMAIYSLLEKHHLNLYFDLRKNNQSRHHS